MSWWIAVIAEQDYDFPYWGTVVVQTNTAEYAKFKALSSMGGFGYYRVVALYGPFSEEPQEVVSARL